MAGEMNLSLLSRGIGEIKKNGHEKIEVKLEPQDYYNWTDDNTDGKRVWRLPPITVAKDVTPRSDDAPSFAASYKLAYIPKTFTTRKGALLLFSEDLAIKNILRKKRRRRRLARSADGFTFRTVDDLAKGILTYGSKAEEDGLAEASPGAKVYLGFIHSRGRKFYERQIKPGFSARRYLGSWSKLWDYSLLSRISEKGLLKHVAQSINEAGYAVKSDTDLSGIPMPYRILRQWLSSPHALDDYTFYRTKSLVIAEAEMAAPRSAKEAADRQPMDTSSNFSESGQLKIVDLGTAVEISYSKLDMKAKEAVLTELLVKSAITQAINKHMEYTEAEVEGQDMATATAKAMSFDLMDAVETLVRNGSGGGGGQGGSSIGSVPHVAHVQFAADLMLPEAPPANTSFKGSKVPKQKGDGSSKSSSVSWGGSEIDHQQQTTSLLPPITNALHHSARLGAGKKSSASSVISDAYQPLPPIGHQTDATTDKLPEGSPATPPTSNQSVANSLAPPVNDSVPVEHHQEDPEYVQWRKSSVDEEKLLAETDREASPFHRPISSVSSVSHPAAEGLRPTHDVGGDGDDHKSIYSHASHFSKHSAATSATQDSEKGAPSAWKDSHQPGAFDPSDLLVSWSYRPPAEVKKIAASAGDRSRSSPAYTNEDTSGQESGDVTMDGMSVDALDVEQVAASAASGPGDQDEEVEPAATDADQSLLDQLTEQASQVARVILSGQSAGQDLVADANMAAELMNEVISPALLSRAQSISSFHSRLSAAESSISEHLRRTSAPESASLHDSEAASRHHGASGSISRTRGQSAASSAAHASLAGDGTPAADGHASKAASSHRSSVPASRATTGRADSVPATIGPQLGDIGDGSSTAPAPPIENMNNQNTGSAAADSSAQMPANGVLLPTNAQNQPAPEDKKGSENQAGTGGGAGDGPLLVITNKDADGGKGSVKSKKSNKSRKSQPEVRTKSGSTGKGAADAAPEVKEDPFVVGKVKDEVELQKLYAPIEPPKVKPPKGPKQPKATAEKKAAPAKETAAKKEAPLAAKGKKKPTKKGVKKGAGKAAAAAAAAGDVEAASQQPGKEQTPSSAQQDEQQVPSEQLESRATSDEEENKPEEEPEMEFIIHRDIESDEDVSETVSEASEAAKPPVKFDFRSLQSLQHSQDEAEPEEEEAEEEDEEDALQNVSNKDARAAKQAAEKERRRQEVERRRREREEQLRRDREEAERRERVQQQLEEERKRREEEKRLRKEREEEEERRLEAEEEERERRRREAEERERRREAEYQRHLADLRRRAEEEEARRRELAAQKAQEEAELRRLEEEMLSKMALEERLEYERRKREEEERRLAAEEEARLRREEEARLAMEAARLLAEESARQQQELQQRLLFQRGLNLEADGLDHAHDITRAFVFSYYELLQWLGVNIPNLADLVQWARGNNSNT